MILGPGDEEEKGPYSQPPPKRRSIKLVSYTARIEIVSKHACMHACTDDFPETGEPRARYM